ncbi:dienelactone hydrolase family protein [uncultured Aquitalea sp.]|uniref:dienelactone hydrolase family protein n=1 Tax=uncultured Aquitalea sp. TaxID=540272 RepID=UPI0025E97F3F|nr:dienelactone hydrolase family protein [uncultured Aquitalea sp.]
MNDSNILDRREFLLGAVATGFALAVQPVTAEAIATDSQGLNAGPVTIGKDSLPAYMARPIEHAGKLPVVLVVQEIFGVHEHIQDICRRLAKLGYLAIAPELYFRQGDPRAVADIPTLMSKIVSKVPDAQVLGDLDATLAWGEKQGGDANRAAITGFCWGGRITWLYAAHNPSIKAGVAWYGKLVGDKTELQPRQAVDIAPSLSVPVLGLYGGKDGGIPLDSVEAMRSALSAGKSGSEIVVYPEAGHAFNADYRPSYVESAARDGWQRLIAWLESHGMKP